MSTIIDHYPSAELAISKGWGCRFGVSSQNKIYKEAIDPDGFIWIEVDSVWMLYVPAFRDGKACLVHQARGDVYAPHSEKTGVIKIGNRRIKPERWYH